RHGFPGGPGLPGHGPSPDRAARAGPDRPRSPAAAPQPTALGEGDRDPRPDARGPGADRPAGDDRAVRVAEATGGVRLGFQALLAGWLPLELISHGLPLLLDQGV